MTWEGGNPIVGTRGKVITEIGLPDGSKLAYSYGVAAGSEGYGWRDRLEQVRRLDNANQLYWGRTYYYEDSNYPYALTGILNQNGSRLATYSFNDSGLLESSEQAGGVDRWAVNYYIDTHDTSLAVRDVTNPLGRTERYYYELPANSSAGAKVPRKLVAIEGSRTANVPADEISFTYDTDDLLASSTDAKGNTPGKAMMPQADVRRRLPMPLALSRQSNGLPVSIFPHGRSWTV